MIYRVIVNIQWCALLIGQMDVTESTNHMITWSQIMSEDGVWLEIIIIIWLSGNVNFKLNSGCLD